MQAGTGGTVAGMAHRLKQLNPDIIIVGVDPHGSILARAVPKPLDAATLRHRAGGIPAIPLCDSSAIPPRPLTRPSPAPRAQKAVDGGGHLSPP